MHINSLALANENQLKCEKVHFLSEMCKLTQNELFSIFIVNTFRECKNKYSIYTNMLKEK